MATANMSPTWLTELPPEVTTRISGFVSGGAQNEDLANFGRTNTSLHEAVFGALCNQLTIFPNRSNNHAFARMCVPATRKLLFNSNEVDDELARILSQTSIDSADLTMAADKAILGCVAKVKSVRKLAVMLFAEEDEKALWECLRGLDLEELELICACGPDFEEDGEMPCLFGKSEYFREGFNVLAECCPRLKVLEVTDCALMDLGRDSWVTIDGLALERMIVRGKVLSLLRDRLPGIAYLKTDEMTDLEEVLSYGDKLLSLEIGACLTGAHMEMLSKCVALEKLGIDVKEGCEEELARVLRGMEGLKSLSLQWGEYEVAGYATVPRGKVLEIVKAAAKVEHLTLGKVRVGLREWKDILKVVGNELETLRLCVTQQDEGALDRWEAMIYLVTTHCPRIRNFHVVDAPSEIRRHERIRRAMEYYKVRCPYGKYMAESMSLLADRVEEMRYLEDEMGDDSDYDSDDDMDDDLDDDIDNDTGDESDDDMDDDSEDEL